MAKVNLSRINSMIKSLREEGQILSRRIQSIPLSASCEVLEGTSDADLASFRDNCQKKRDELFALMDGRNEIGERICHLRSVLDAANRKFGVNDLLLEMGNVQSRMELYERQLSQLEMRDGNDPDFGALRDAAYYHTALNEKTRVYEFTVNLVSEDDIRKLREKLDALRKQREEIKDRLARLNQTKFVEIDD